MAGVATIGFSGLGTGVWTFVVTLLATLAGGMLMRKSERVQVFVGIIGGVILGVGAGVVVNRYHEYRLNHGTVKFGVQTLVRLDVHHGFAPRVAASPGQKVEFSVPAQNLGTGIARNVVFGVNLAPYETPVCDSTRLSDSNTTASGIHLAPGKPGGCLGSSLFEGGDHVDDMAPEATETITFWVTISPCIPPGKHALQTVGIVSSTRGRETYNVGVVTLDVPAGTSRAGCPSGG